MGYLRKIESDLDIASAIGHIVIWAVLILITFGFAGLLYPYSFIKNVLNKTYIVDDTGSRVGRLKCELDMGSQIGHAIIWFFLSIITLGICFLIYYYKVAQYAIEKTVIEPV